MRAREFIRLYNAGERDFRGVSLRRAKLSKAKLSWVNLQEADLSEANLNEVEVTSEQLALAYSLEGATMPDGTKHR